MLRILYCIYQLFVAVPVTIVATVLTALEVGKGKGQLTSSDRGTKGEARRR